MSFPSLKALTSSEMDKEHIFRALIYRPPRLALILSRALQNVSPFSGLNVTKPMSLENSIFIFIVPLCHVLQQKCIYLHQSFSL